MILACLRKHCAAQLGLKNVLLTFGISFDWRQN